VKRKNLRPLQRLARLRAKAYANARRAEAIGREKVLTRAENKQKIRRKIIAMQIARMPRKGINRWKKEEVVLSAEAVSLLGGADRSAQTVVDSGTALHMHRDRDAFESISESSVNIRGVGGTGRGYKGLLRQCRLGVGIPAIWYEQLPVKMLISTEGLKRDNWETHIELDKSYLLNPLSGTVLPITKGPSGLPVIDDLFSEHEDSFVCNPCAEVDADYNPAFNVESLPRGIRGALAESISKMQNLKRRKNREKRISKLTEHRRNCHLHDDDLGKVQCHDCLHYKGRKEGHEKERPDRFKTPTPFMLFSTDFFGPLQPTSLRGNRWVMLYACDHCAYAYAEPIARKSEAPQVLERFAKMIRKKTGADRFSGKNENEKAPMVMGGIRSDNEPVLRSQAWRDVCERYNIEETHSVPYEPQMNGTAERFVQTVKNALRVVTAHTDVRLWDFAVEHIVRIWNMRKRKRPGISNCCSPDEVVAQVTTNHMANRRGVSGRQKYLRRYGCLAYFKPHLTKADKDAGVGTALQPKRKRGIHLGFSAKNSSWLIGTVSKGKFHVYETRSVTFIEDILVKNVRELESPDPPIFQQLLDLVNAGTGEGATAGAGKPVAGAGADDRIQGLEVVKWEREDTGTGSDRPSNGSAEPESHEDYKLIPQESHSPNNIWAARQQDRSQDESTVQNATPPGKLQSSIEV
jgi:hypothetical protein